MRLRSIRRGDCVVFRKWKQSTSPGTRAQQIHPAAMGDNYLYSVEKIWRVIDVLGNGNLLLRTHRGKTHVIDADDPNLRPLTLIDRIRHRSRITRLEP